MEGREGVGGRKEGEVGEERKEGEVGGGRGGEEGDEERDEEGGGRRYDKVKRDQGMGGMCWNGVICMHHSSFLLHMYAFISGIIRNTIVSP